MYGKSAQIMIVFILAELLNCIYGLIGKKPRIGIRGYIIEAADLLMRKYVE